MKIDTEICHVTKPGANLFLELGFAPAEAKRLQAASRKQINVTQLLKLQLMEELSTWITEHHLKQTGYTLERRQQAKFHEATNQAGPSCKMAPLSLTCQGKVIHSSKIRGYILTFDSYSYIMVTSIYLNIK